MFLVLVTIISVLIRPERGQCFDTSHYVRPLYLYSSDLSEVNVFGTSHYVRPLYLYSSELSEVNVLILVTMYDHYICTHQT
jgi:hypothetical protein